MRTRPNRDRQLGTQSSCEPSELNPFSGVSTQYIVDVPGMATASVFEQNLDVEPVSARPGDQVWLTWDEGHAFVVAGGDHLNDGVVIEDAP